MIEKTIIEAQMKIRRPVAQVFEAMINPEITTKFWFTRSDAKLEAGKTVKWEWEMYGAEATVHVKEIIPDKLIKFGWGQPQTTVEFLFEELANDSTYVVIRNYGFKLEGYDLIEAVKDNTGGFTTVLDGMKFYLEHGIEANLISDKFSKE